MKYPVIDLHSDLLGSIAESPQTLDFESPETRSSLPQLEQGGVRLQTFVIAVIEPKDCVSFAKQQVSLYHKLLRAYPTRIASSRNFKSNLPKVHGFLAIENALGLIGEDEPLEKAFVRFDEIDQVEQILYVSLTWNQENRFGGGNLSSKGLQSDGKIFLDFLGERKAAIDLSHTSDPLAYDIINHIDKKGLNVPLIASHSNFRNIKNSNRNLPEELALEIVRRKGLIGINFVRRFVGDRPEDFLRLVEYAFSIGAENTLCLGSDFYGGATPPLHLNPEYLYPPFQDEFSNSSCFPHFAKLLEKILPPENIKKIFYANAAHFLQKMGFISKEQNS